MSNSLIGCWRTDKNDSQSIIGFGDALIQFSPEGAIVYTLFERGVQKKMYLTYEVDGHEIITNQPTRPKIERTQYRLLSNDKLELVFNGETVRFVRVEA